MYAAPVIAEDVHMTHLSCQALGSILTGSLQITSILVVLCLAYRNLPSRKVEKRNPAPTEQRLSH